MGSKKERRGGQGSPGFCDRDSLPFIRLAVNYLYIHSANFNMKGGKYLEDLWN